MAQATQEKTDIVPILLGGGIALTAAYFIFKKAAAAEKYTLTIESGPNGSTSPPPGVYEYAANTEVYIYAAANQGYKFDRWTGDVPVALETVNPVSLLITRNMSIKANFVVNPSPVMYRVTFEASAGGSVSPSGTQSYEQNSYVTVLATADPGYKFVGWSGDWTGTENPTYVYINKDNMVVRANFSPVQQSGVQLQVGWNGPITYNGNPGTCDQVFASVVPYLLDLTKPIWIYRDAVWYWWFPNTPANELNPPPNNIVMKGDLVHIYVTQACFWTWI
jgi:uncharacterized repeat protein (TIGR02543 family)